MQNEYLESLLLLLSEFHDGKNRDRWYAEFKRVDAAQYSQSLTPLMLALCHPDFRVVGGSSFDQEIHGRASRSFSNRVGRHERCQMEALSKVRCKFNEFPDIRGRCEIDHMWPWALGGPTVLSNSIRLCRFHNATKSSGIEHFPWNGSLEWIPLTLQQVATRYR